MATWSSIKSALVAVIIFAIVSTIISLVFFHRWSWDAGSEIGTGLIVFCVAALLTFYVDRRNTRTGAA